MLTTAIWILIIISLSYIIEEYYSKMPKEEKKFIWKVFKKLLYITIGVSCLVVLIVYLF